MTCAVCGCVLEGTRGFIVDAKDVEAGEVYRYLVCSGCGADGVLENSPVPLVVDAVHPARYRLLDR